jgi:hypothetical protein
MNLSRRFGIRINTRFLIFGLVIWWLAMFLGYAIISFRTERLSEKISKSGIEIAQELSKLVSLPLLEKKDQAIHSLLNDTAQKKGVVYASVLDHRNKVVAFTGIGQLVPNMTETKRSIEQVSIWEGGFTSHAKILNFASDVNYAGTKIGEILIGLSTSETANAKNQYIIVAVISFLALLLAFMFMGYPTMKTFLMKYINYRRTNPATDSTVKGSLVHCPMCGTQKPFNDKLFTQSNFDKFLTIGASKHDSNPGGATNSKRINLNELAKNEDLSWIRRRIIRRCTEIITKLAA